MATQDSFLIWPGGHDPAISYEELKRRRAIALALASRQKGFPKNIGEGLTYLGEAIGERIGDWRLSAAEKAREGQIAREQGGVLGGGVPAITPAVDAAPAVTSSAEAPPAIADAAPAADGGGLGGGGGGGPVAVASPPPTTPPLPSTLPPEPPRTPAPIVAADPGPFSPQGRINEAFSDVGRQPLRPLPPAPGTFADRFGAATPPRQPLPATFADRFDALGGGVTPPSAQPTPDQAFNPNPAMGGPPPPPPVAAPAPVPPPAKPVAAAPADGDPLAQYARGIAGIESGGAKDPYSLVGARTKSGDRAMGKYQIMGANVPSWTEAALGRRLTPQQFLASPEAQEATFRHRFGQYADKYGPEGAARAWYAGEGGMKNLGATDVHGRLTVAGYGKDFLNRIGGNGGGGPIVVPGSRDAIAIAAMPRARPAVSPGVDDSALLAEVAGVQNANSYAPTAALGRDDVASDAPVPGISPTGAIAAPGIGRTLQNRRGGQLPPLPVQPPVDPNLPPAMRPLPGSVAPPPGSGPVPAPPPVVPPSPVSGPPPPPPMGMNLPPAPEAAAITPAPVPAAQGIRPMPPPVMSDAAPVATPAGAQLAQAQPARPQTPTALPPLPPGMERIPMPRLEQAPVTPVEHRAREWAAQYPNDPDRQARAQAIIAPLANAREETNKRLLEDWKVKAQASKARDAMISEYYRDYEKNQLGLAKTRGDVAEQGRKEALSERLGGRDPEKFFSDFNKQKESAQKQATVLQQAAIAREAIKAGVITGFGANQRTDWEAAKAWIAGNKTSGDLVSNTERMEAAMKNMLAQAIENIQGQDSRVSDTDIKVASGVIAADPKLQQQTIEKILTENTRVANQRLNDFEDQRDYYLGGTRAERQFQLPPTPSAPQPHIDTLLKHKGSDEVKAEFDKRFGAGAAQLEIDRAKRRERRGQ